MIKTVKNYLVPHAGNEYKPHLLRETSVTAIFVLAFMLFCTSLGSNYILNRTNLGAAVLPAVLVDLTNEHRVKNNQKPLALSPTLEKAAMLKAQDMNKNQYFAHVSPTGVTPWQWFVKAGYRFVYAGENLAINFDDSTTVEKAWINSPTHHANLISEKFNETGIAVYKGTYQGRSTTFVVQLFGKRPQMRSSSVLGANVSGATIEEDIAVVPVLLVDEPTFAVAQNSAVLGDETSLNNVVFVHYATAGERWLAAQSRYVQWFYIIAMVIVYLVLISMVVVEFRTQHTKNIIMAVLLLIALGVLAFLNSSLTLSFF